MNQENYEIIKTYNEIIFKIYKNKGLVCLADKSVEIKSYSVLSSYHDTIQLFINKVPHKNFNALIEDILICSKDLKFCVGNLFLHKPYINNPLKQSFQIGKLDVFPRFQNIFDRRYSMYSSMASEKLYNFWDRIGDLLNAILQVVKDSKKEYFFSVIDKIPEEMKYSNNYKWLYNFRNNEFKEFNNIRKNVVHHRMLETNYILDHLDALHDRKAIIKLQSEKEKLAKFYKDHLSKTINGFEKTISFLRDYNEIMFNNAN